MSVRRLWLTAAAVMTLLIWMIPAQAGVASGGAWGTRSAGADMEPTQALPVLLHHRRQATSYYCYPRNYWWFYRPYTTAKENYARCMPYFHYPPEAYNKNRRGHYDPDFK